MTVYAGGIVVDGTGSDPAPVDLYVQAGRLVPSGDRGEDVVDCTGLFLTPGLIDAHVHLGLSSDLGKSLRHDISVAELAADIFTNLSVTLDGGFTTVRDCGGIDGGVARTVACRSRCAKDAYPSPMPHPFASPAWLEALRTEIDVAVAELPPDGAFSFGERYVVGEDRGRGWHIRWADGLAQFAAVPADDVDVELVIDLEVARRSCSPMTTELARLQREAVRDGRILWRGDPKTLPQALQQVHERMIALTSPS